MFRSWFDVGLAVGTPKSELDDQIREFDVVVRTAAARFSRSRVTLTP